MPQTGERGGTETLQSSTRERQTSNRGDAQTDGAAAAGVHRAVNRCRFCPRLSYHISHQVDMTH